MMALQQTTIFGGEVPHDEAANLHRAQHAPLTLSQREIVRFIREHGTIRPVQAGTIEHRHRHGGQGCYGGRINGWKPAEHACCAYAATDGVAALKRLVRRGIVDRVSKGVYTIGDGTTDVDRYREETHAS